MGTSMIEWDQIMHGVTTIASAINLMKPAVAILVTKTIKETLERVGLIGFKKNWNLEAL